MTKLKDITGKALSGEWGTDDETGVGIPVLRTTNFTNEGIVNYENVVTRIITKKDISEKYLQSGDIIIEKSGGSDKQPVGRVIYFDGPENTYLFNNFTGLLRVRDKNEWFPRYVFYSLFANYKKGGTRPFENKTTGLHNLKTDDYVSRYEITEIPLNKQVAICAQLDQILKVINLRRKEISNLDDLIKARFVEMFGDPVYSAIDSKIELSDICEKITDGEHGSVARVANGHPFLNAKHILKTGFIDWKTITYIGDEDHQRIYKRCNPEKGDILLTTTGTIGNVAIMPECEEVSMDRGITLLKINRHKVTSEFVAEMLKHPSIQMAMGANVHASAIGHLFMNKVKKLPSILPSMKKQIEFTTFVQQIDKSKLLSGCRLFHSWAPEIEISRSMLACPDGEQRICGDVDANNDAGRPGKS